jgi:hypothetical protein
MSKQAHTRGPWQQLPEEVDKSYIRIRGTQLGRRYKVANVLTPTYEGAPEQEAEQTRANAHLIAAAPDLLQALIEVTASLAWNAHGECRAVHDGPIMPSSQAVGVARAAIAKATGSAP